MKIKYYILVLCLPFLLISSKCNDKPILNKETKILRGRLMYDCNTPAANEPVRFKASPAFIETIDGEIEVYTDENGYFEFIHNSTGSWYQLWAPYKTLEKIPSKPELDLGEIILNGTVNFLIKLQVNGTNYTSSDTLYYTNWSYPNPSSQTLKIPGPFTSGVIDTALNVLYPKTLIYNTMPQLNMTYYVNTPEDNTVYFDVPICSLEFGEVTFVLP